MDRCHHSKEEAELFPQLEAHGAGAIATRLEAEHAVGRRLAAAYGQAADAYTPGEVATGVRVAAAARAYADFLRVHIELETCELFPAIEDKLQTYDSALVEAFESIDPFVRPVSAGRQILDRTRHVLELILVLWLVHVVAAWAGRARF